MDNLFDKYYEKYDIWYEKNEFVYKSELEAIKKVFPKEGKGLEIGVGTGRFASSLNIEYGIDPSIKMLEIAKKRGVKVFQSYGEKLPFVDEMFDYVGIFISICFVEEPQKVIKEAFRVLKKRAKIIIGIVDKNSFLGKYYQEKNSVFYKSAKFFEVKEITTLLANAGFKDFDYWQTLFCLPDKIDKIQEPEKGFGKGGFIVVSLSLIHI